MPHTSASLKAHERLWRRLRRLPLKQLAAQIHPDKPLKIFTASRVIAIWPDGATSPWFGTLGGTDRNDPHLSSASTRRSHAIDLDYAALYRRIGKFKIARGFIIKAAFIRTNKAFWRPLP